VSGIKIDVATMMDRPRIWKREVGERDRQASNGGVIYAYGNCESFPTASYQMRRL
jgi:hypothetical protein